MMKSEVDGNGWPIVSHPADAGTLSSMGFQVTKFFLNQCVWSFVIPSYVTIRLSLFKGEMKLSDLTKLYNAISDAHYNPINKLPEYQDKELIQKLWEKDSAKPYIEGDALEYQTQEGYCSSATIRCTLKSFPSYPREKIPPQKFAPSDPDKWQELDVWGEASTGDGGGKKSANLEIVPGSCSYPEFLRAVKRGLDDPSCRVVLNFLRPALFGFFVPWWLPGNIFVSLVAGHFSPIVGMIETEKYKGDNPLIGVFDVNHKYGGAYLVPAKILYRSVELMDPTSEKPRAMILVHEPSQK